MEHELPESWGWTTIGEVAETTSGGTPSRKIPEYYGGAIPWVKSGELNDNIITEVEEFITTKGLENSSAKVFQRGTVLVAMYGATVGKTGILGIDATTNQAICAIFPLKNAFTSKFIMYWLQSQRQVLIDQSAGGAQPNINQEIVRSFPLPLAPLQEQHRIVAAIEQQFSRLDAAVTSLQHARAKLKRQRAAILKAAVEGTLTEVWRTEHPASETAEQLLQRILNERRAKWEADQLAKMQVRGVTPKDDKWKDAYKEPEPPDTTELPELPEGWHWATVEQLASTHKYSLAIGPFGSNLKVEDYRHTGIPLIFVRNIRSRVFDGPDTRYVTKEKAKELYAHRVAGGDILITKMGDPPGDACLYPEIMPSAIITADCIKWTLSSALSQRRFFVNSINSSLVKRQILRITKGVAQLKVSLERFKLVAVPLPPLAEQQQIVSEVEARLSIIAQTELEVEANLKRAEQLRQTILAEAFAGRLVPQDPSDEPASVLLERIRKERDGMQKKGKAANGRAITVPDELVQIEVEGTRQVELWESVGGG